MAVHYVNIRLRRNTVVILPAGCPPQCGAYSRELLDEKSKSMLFPGAAGGTVGKHTLCKLSFVYTQ